MAVDSRQNLFISGLVAVAVSGVVSLATLSLAEEMMMSPPPDGGGGTPQTYTAPPPMDHPMDSGSQYTPPSGGTTYPSGGSQPMDHQYDGMPSTGSPSGTQQGGSTTGPWGGSQQGSGGPWGGGMGGQGGGMQGGSMGGQGGMTSGGGYQGQGGPFGGQGHEGAPYGRGQWQPTPGEGRGAPSEESFGRWNQGGSEADMTKMRDEMMQHGKKFQEEMMGQGQEMMRKGMEDMKKGFGEFGSAGGMGRPSFGEGGMPGGMGNMMGGQHGSFPMPFSFPGMSSQGKGAASQVDRILKNLPTEEGTGLTADQEAKIDSAVTKADSAVDKAEATLEKLFTGTKAPTANKVLKQLNALVTHFNTAMQLEAFSDGASDLADHVSELIADTCSAADEAVKGWEKKGEIMCEKFFDYLESSEGL